MMRSIMDMKSAHDAKISCFDESPSVHVVRWNSKAIARAHWMVGMGYRTVGVCLFSSSTYGNPLLATTMEYSIGIRGLDVRTSSIVEPAMSESMMATGGQLPFKSERIASI